MLPDLGNDFCAKEFVHPEIYEEKGLEAIGYVDVNMIEISKILRKEFGPVTINDWAWGGVYKDSGLRLDYGSRFSAHMYGKGLDWKFQVPVKDVYDFILANQEEFYDLGLRRLEDIDRTPTWLHGDSLETDDTEEGKIYVFKP